MILPKPRFHVGQKIRVLLNARNSTAREGTIDRIVWHHALARYAYFIRVPGKTVPTKAVSKRYFDDDLAPLPSVFKRDCDTRSESAREVD